jgi:diguanylate cyclase (GGDEF)-like protein
MVKANILFVEDSKTQGVITKAFLEKNGYEVTWVVDGISAFREATTRPIDVILLDRILPDMDGNEMCRWLKQNQETKGIPIIMLTARNTVTDKVQGLESGADDYLPKPYEEVELNARVTAALRTKRLQDELKQKNDEMRDMLAKVEALSITDPLTGLYNRRRFESILEVEFEKAIRYKAPLSCMMIDIDHFKAVNDTYGHPAGDEVLRAVAHLIKKGVRNVDAACRWGGEEFIVLTPMTAKAFAIQPARRIWRSVSEQVFSAMNNNKLTISIGIADVSTPEIDTPNKLVHAADIMLYQAKKNGRNRIEVTT